MPTKAGREGELLMRCKSFSIGLRATLAIFVLTLLAAGTRAVAQREEVLYSFGSSRSDAVYPYAGLIVDGAGNLYGTTLYGGAHNSGTVFELTPKAGGGWKEKVLYAFNNNGKDGFYPYAAVIAAAGNLYGTTFAGGAHNGGTVFELTPKAGGGWTEKVLHSFGGGKDGTSPRPALIIDAADNLYGTTVDGGADGSGTVFELTPQAGGKWAEKVLHSFGNGKDGASPYAGLIADAAGNLYGTTFYGGTDGLGMVFELTPKKGEKWAEKVLHSFDGEDGQDPSASLVFDGSGDLYGTTEDTIFELTPETGGRWKEGVLHNSGSTASLIFDTAGNLYGTTSYGGAQGDGTMFELTRNAHGEWMYTTLFDFTGISGMYPLAGLVIGAKGKMYGTTSYGGTQNLGTLFEFTH
jgi:uncharacterized repeat protein (TIGR03803 family)